MCGGDEDLFVECEPILKVMGTDVVYCGAAGAGNTTKLANQIIVASNIAAVAEGFMLAKKAGVDPTRCTRRSAEDLREVPSWTRRAP